MTILLFGDINLDITLQVPAYPEAGQDVIVQQVSYSPGGSIANAAIVLARLGNPVRLMARAGQDAVGDQALAALQASGVDLTLVQRDQSFPTGQIIIVVTPDGERTMFSSRGANAWITPESLDENALEGVSWLHLSTYSLLAAPQKLATYRLIELAQHQEIPISLDIADGHAGRLLPELKRLISRFDTLMINPADASALLSTAVPIDHSATLTALLDLGLRVVALKLGASGCLIAADGEAHPIPPLPVTVVDTTGAGDAFAAGLIHGQLHTLSIEDSAWLASILGALTTTVRGAGTSLPDLQALRNYLLLLPPAASPEDWRKRLLAQIG